VRRSRVREGYRELLHSGELQREEENRIFILMNSMSKRIPAAAVFLGALAFFFLYSQLGVPEIHGARHDAHGFCVLMKISVNHQKPLKHEFAKANLVSQFRTNSSLNPLRGKRGAYTTDHPEVAALDDMYIRNRIILI
jgi:hypothetical protein